MAASLETRLEAALSQKAQLGNKATAEKVSLEKKMAEVDALWKAAEAASLQLAKHKDNVKFHEERLEELAEIEWINHYLDSLQQIDWFHKQKGHWDNCIKEVLEKLNRLQQVVKKSETSNEMVLSRLAPMRDAAGTQNLELEEEHRRVESMAEERLGAFESACFQNEGQRRASKDAGQDWAGGEGGQKLAGKRGGQNFLAGAEGGEELEGEEGGQELEGEEGGRELAVGKGGQKLAGKDGGHDWAARKYGKSQLRLGPVELNQDETSTPLTAELPVFANPGSEGFPSEALETARELLARWTPDALDEARGVIFMVDGSLPDEAGADAGSLSEWYRTQLERLVASGTRKHGESFTEALVVESPEMVRRTLEASGERCVRASGDGRTSEQVTSHEEVRADGFQLNREITGGGSEDRGAMKGVVNEGVSSRERNLGRDGGFDSTGIDGGQNWAGKEGGKELAAAKGGQKLAGGDEGQDWGATWKEGGQDWAGGEGHGQRLAGSRDGGQAEIGAGVDSERGNRQGGDNGVTEERACRKRRREDTNQYYNVRVKVTTEADESRKKGKVGILGVTPDNFAVIVCKCGNCIEKGSLCGCETCVSGSIFREKGRVLTPNEFATHVGRGHKHNWKESLYIDGKKVSEWELDTRRRGMEGRRRSGFCRLKGMLRWD